MKLEKSEQIQESGECFPLSSTAGKLLGNIIAQAMLHHPGNFGTAVSLPSRAGSSSCAEEPLQDLEAENDQVTWRERGGQHPCSTP